MAVTGSFWRYFEKLNFRHNLKSSRTLGIHVKQDSWGNTLLEVLYADSDCRQQRGARQVLQQFFAYTMT